MTVPGKATHLSKTAWQFAKTPLITRPANEIQTFEKTKPVLKSTAPNMNDFATSPDGNDNRQRLITAGLPIALIAGFCLLSFAQRTVQGFVDNHSAKQANRLNVNDAKYIAGSLCEELTGSKTQEVETSQQAAFSLRRNKDIHEWEVVCVTEKGARYLVRINAATRGVYSVNRVDNNKNSLTIARPASLPLEQPAISLEKAHQLAAQYLQASGVPLEKLTFIQQETRLTPEDKLMAEGFPPSPVYCFSYSRAVPGIGRRVIKIGVNRYTGEVEFIWNPVAAL